ncbi:helix-turn-helix domain-containing protein [Glutamicibacter protophormiae]|uniref:HTH cro/C1-type domain-containing protein n=2 Tax=Glutamicibacter protophormiae TaxID=37930 RepID=A0ABS4XQ73_GLUPR|nr:helix-turn-helix transcriptional regulator [Glutamicibacter protophormiae]MBP2398657.1 hypothetical protein [Glutamicibacter protophormiae]
MEPEKKRERGRDIGKTGATVAANIKRYRSDRVSLRELEDRLEKLGVKISASGLQKIEAGTRRVDADELMALAVALNVNPNALLFPANSPSDDMSEQVTAAPKGQTEGEIWEWANGLRLLDNQEPLKELYFPPGAEAHARNDDPLHSAHKVMRKADTELENTIMLFPLGDDGYEAEQRLMFQAHYHAMNLKDDESLSLWHINGEGQATEVASLPYLGGHMNLWVARIKETILGIATKSVEASLVREDLKKALKDSADGND